MFEETINKFAEDAQLLLDMCNVYPGDPDGTMQRQAKKLFFAADFLQLLDEQEDEVKVEVTYL